MKVCLVAAPTVAEFGGEEECDSQVVRSAAAEPQLGILSLAAVLEQLGLRPTIFNPNHLFLKGPAAVGVQDFAAMAAGRLAGHDAELYGFSSICSSYPLTVRIAKQLKHLRPAATIVFGGPQASVVDQRTLAVFPFVDLVLRGEAEITLPALLTELNGERHLQCVPGLTYRDGFQVRRNSNAPVIVDLDSLPLPAYHLTGELEGATNAALELGRGCPFACTFCSTNDFFRRSFRLRSPGRVLEDMHVIAARYKIRDFELVHDMFTVDRRRVVTFCEAMIGSGEGFTWSCSARTDCVDEELLDLMWRAGCRDIFFGVETGSARMQRIIDKHLDPSRARQVIDLCDRLGIGTTVSLIMGFAEETPEDLRQTISMYLHSARHARSRPQLCLLAPLAETPQYAQHKHELVLDELCSDMSHQGLHQNEDDLDLIHKYPEIFPNFYLIPTPRLNRGEIVELREFMLMANARFRWLLCAIDQSTPEMVDFFLSWRAYRFRLLPALSGLELRHYYRTAHFREDFLAFVRGSAEAKSNVVEALLFYEEACQGGELPASVPAGQLLDKGAPICWTDVPVRAQGTLVVELPFDIQAIVEGLKNRSTPRQEAGRHFYAAWGDGGIQRRLHRVSEWTAGLLRACDGRRMIGEVWQQLSAEIQEPDPAVGEYIFVKVLEGAQADELLDIYRTMAAAEASHDGGLSAFA